MHALATPRNVLAEIKRSKTAPWWVRKHFTEIEEHLSTVQFKGKPLLDTPMSEAQIQAVLEEAVEAVRKPATIESLVREHDRLTGGA